ncbi:twin-arginine translocase TatA/TatE family subunit [Marinimicrobium locisalis]|uniref:twin-arginine translocase TatA/TatE family subunit n=1 Tax=Marinimicrobium locisalis TaxID=546022 RepID=UPI003221627B
MGLSVWQIVLVVILFLLLFGRGKIPQLMGDLADGIKSFKKGVSEDDTEKEDALAGHLKQTDAERDSAAR